MAPPAKTPPAPNKRRWVWIAIAPLLAILLGAYLYGLFAGYRVANKPGDRRLVVTFEDLAPLPAGITKSVKLEKIERLFYTDGSREVTYEYDASEEKAPIYLSCTVSQSISDRDARNEFLGRTAAVPLGSLVAGASLEEKKRDDLLKWGDESRSTLLLSKGEPVGNYFMARKGSRLFSLMLSGIYYDDPETFRAVVQPHLDALDRDGL